MSWAPMDMQRRLLSVVLSVPEPAVGSKSAQAAAFVSYALDMAIVQTLATHVLLALTCERPHPVFGDDGIRDVRRETATASMAWAERWVAWRNANNWDNASRCTFGATPWGAP